jgi:hypothetical protein
MSCPECGNTAITTERSKPETDAAGNFTAKQMEQWTGVSQEPAQQAKAQFDLLKGLKVVCLCGVFICAFMYVPCFVIPTATGADRYGFYTFPSTKSRTPTKMSSGGMMALNIGNTIALIACFGGYLYFKRKAEDTEAELENEDMKIF